MKLILGQIPIMLEPMPLGPKIMSNCELSNPTTLFRFFFKWHTISIITDKEISFALEL